MMTRSVATQVAISAMLFATASITSADRRDPFAFLAPDVIVEPVERDELDAGETLVRVLPGRDGFLALSAIVRVDANADRLVAWSGSVETLQKGKYVSEIGRFSMPPRIDDLRGLTLEAEDLEAVEQCRPGRCEVKLSDAEMARLRATPDRAHLDAAFRQMLVDRATDYVFRGDSYGLPYHDHKAPLRPADAFASVVQRLQFLPRSFPCYAGYLRGYPLPDEEHVRQSFLYWSKETLGMKPIISITHFSVARFTASEMPEVAVVAKQVYATHYKDAALTVTALTGDHERRYLVYVHRSRVDAFQGLFGGVVRRIVERRVKAEAPGVLLGLRKRLESGDPLR